MANTESYVVNYSEGNIQLFVGASNIAYANLKLFGRNWTDSNVTNGYGQAINQNFVSLAENFASVGTAFGPVGALTGQLWYDKNTDILKVKKGDRDSFDWVNVLDEDTTLTKIENGTSSVSIPEVSGNVLLAAGGITRMTVTSSGVTISGAVNMSGSGNITLNGGQLIVPLATGSGGSSLPPLVVDSSLMVGNLNAQYVGNIGVDPTFAATANTIAVWRPGGSLTGNFNGNFNGNFTGNGANLTGIVASTASTVTSPSQPNITSVGTLTSLGVSGAVTVGGSVTSDSIVANNITVRTNTGTFNGDAGGLINIPGGNVIGAVSSALTAQTVLGANVSGAVAFATTANSVAGSNVSGPVAVANVAGSVSSAFQPNITSVGTLTSLNVSGNISGNVITGILAPTGGTGNAGIVFPSDIGGGSGDIATIQYYAYTGENTVLEIAVTNDIQDYIYLNGSGGTRIANTLTVTGDITASSGNITSANLSTGSITTTGSVRTTALTTGANTISGIITGSWTLSAGSRLQSTYADLAEYYYVEQVPGLVCGPGTVVEFGGNADIRVCDTDMSHRVAGVISTNPAYIMNDNNDGRAKEPVALQGRVPCKVIGKVQKGDMMVSAGNGYARAENEPKVGTVIGKSLENKETEGEGIIEVAVGRL